MPSYTVMLLPPTYAVTSDEEDMLHSEIRNIANIASYTT
jgi:hypothetical protein